MTAMLFLTGLLLCSPSQTVAQPPPVQAPDRPGVFAITNRGAVELTVFGEQRQVEIAVPSFNFAPSKLDQIPVVSSVQAFYVNIMGWVPKDLYLIVGRKRLATPREDYRRLNGRAYSKGPVLFEVVTEKLEPAALEKEYQRLAGKGRTGEDLRAFIVVELASQSGLSRRSYPIQVEIRPGSAR